MKPDLIFMKAMDFFVMIKDKKKRWRLFNFKTLKYRIISIIFTIVNNFADKGSMERKKDDMQILLVFSIIVFSII